MYGVKPPHIWMMVTSIPERPSGGHEEGGMPMRGILYEDEALDPGKRKV